MNLYRGFSRFKEIGIHKNPFLDKPRTPRDTKKNVHEVADKWFLNQFGHRFRSQAVICSTDKEQAEGYMKGGGSLRLIKPVGSYVALYAPDLYDFTDYEQDFTNKNCQNTIEAWLTDQNFIAVTSLEDIKEDFEGEVMLYCTEYEAEQVS